MLRKYLLSDSSVSLLLHGLKSGIALLINWMVLTEFSAPDYVIWAVSSSIFVVATASDLGIGQFATTQFIHSDRQKWAAIARDATIAMVPLVLGAIAFVFLALGDQPWLYKAATAVFIGFRVLAIPFGAVLNAVNQFKLRKAVEGGTYLLAAPVIAWIAYSKGSVIWALLVLNAAFMVGGFLIIYLATRYLETSKLWAARSSLDAIVRVYRSSIPFMVNNLTSLLTYGGFIWISSFILATDALARLSVLHTFILINAYQVYDVILRARQADLVNPAHVARMHRFNTFLMVCSPVVAFFFGSSILSLLTKSMTFSQAEILLFSFFVSLEFGFLLIQSIMQVRPEFSYLLSRYSVAKLFCQAAAIGIWWLTAGDNTMLTSYIAILTGASLLGYVACRQHLSLQLRRAGA